MKKNIIIIGVVCILICEICVSQNTINPDGYNKFYYDNGNVSSEGLMRDGKPDGYWKTYYSNNVLKSEGNRKDFLLDSLWKFYGEDGKLTLEVNYRDGKKDGIKRVYNKSGIKISEENFIADVNQGISNYYYDDGNILKTINFVNGKREGKSVEYSEEGLIITLSEYKNDFLVKEEKINRTDKNDLKQGVWKEFHSNGRVKIEGKYKDDKKHGYFREYSSNGELLNTNRYEQGDLIEAPEEFTDIEVVKEYYPGAKIKSEMTYINNVPNGVYREYSIEGKISASKLYKDGIVTGDGIVDKKGEKQDAWKEYYPTGMLKAQGNYKNGERTGEWIFYSRNIKTGRVVKVDMERMIRKIQELTGEKFMAENWEK